MSNTDEPKLFPHYVTFYQLPEDGCQSGMLPGYEPAPDYWGPGHEVQITSEPLGTPLTQRTIDEGFGDGRASRASSWRTERQPSSSQARKVRTLPLSGARS
jgi:hypothetical protein